MTENTTGTIVTEKEARNPCWWCRSEVVWMNDFTKEEWCMEGEGMVSILVCSGCGAEVRYIEREEEDEP
jgi:hypothetical protein